MRPLKNGSPIKAIIPDTNLFLYAYDASSPYHERSKTWFESALGGRETVGLVYPVLFAFLRIATSRKVYQDPMSLEEASGHVKAWIQHGTTTIIDPPASFLEDTLHLLSTAGSVGGNLVTDAQIAALALSCKGVVHTSDRDFLRFPGVKVRFPLDEQGRSQ